MVSYHQLGVLNSSLHFFMQHVVVLICFASSTRDSLFRVKYAGIKVVPDETLESSFFFSKMFFPRES